MQNQIEIQIEGIGQCDIATEQEYKMLIRKINGSEGKKNFFKQRQTKFISNTPFHKYLKVNQNSQSYVEKSKQKVKVKECKQKKKEIKDKKRATKKKAIKEYIQIMDKQEQLKIPQDLQLQIPKIGECNFVQTKWIETNNIDNFLKYILQKNYTEITSIVDQQKIPTSFQTIKAYRTIFQFYLLNQTVSAIHSDIEKAAKKNQAIECYVKIQGLPNNGFTIFIANQSSQQKRLYQLSLSRNNMVLISNKQFIEKRKYTIQKFNCGKDAVFLGYLQYDQKISNKIRIKTMIKRQPYYFIFGNEFRKVFVYHIGKLSTHIREYQAIRNLQFFQQKRLILNPSLIQLEGTEYIQNHHIYHSIFKWIDLKYNKGQQHAIKEAALRRQGIVLLQGPPGTGKTFTLIGILSCLHEYLKNMGSRKKILICAPSNTAIDEILIRVLKNGLGENNFKPKTLRMGIIDQNTTNEVKQVSLEHQSQKLLLKIKNQAKSIPELILQKNKIERKLKSKKFEQQKVKLIEERKRIQIQIMQIKSLKIRQKQEYTIICNTLIAQAFLIFSTTSSSTNQKLLKWKYDIQYLIVDEAAQATEPNILIPFLYNPKKIILIGDPKQLPATTFLKQSNKALYDRSLFQRLIQGGQNPHFLDTQYRMDAQIRQFPSKMFYNNRLKDAQQIKNRQKFILPSISFIDIVKSKQRVIQKSFQNEQEVKMIKLVVQKIQSFKRQLSIGIITPYKQQTRLLRNTIKKHMINTIDSFQGQERDIIIFSTVRSSANGGIGFLLDERRINVALSRAKLMLMIVGNSFTLSSNQIWDRLILDYSIKKRYYKIEDIKYNQFIHKFINGHSLNQIQTYDRIQRKVFSKDTRKSRGEIITINQFQQEQPKCRVERSQGRGKEKEWTMQQADRIGEKVRVSQLGVMEWFGKKQQRQKSIFQKLMQRL